MAIYVSYTGQSWLFCGFDSYRIAYRTASLISRSMPLGYTVANKSGMLIVW